MNNRRQYPTPPAVARALLIQGHPRASSFNHALGAAWADGAERAGVPVETLVLAELDFDPRFRDDAKMVLEPDLATAQRLIADAGHITVGFPVWWGSTPSLLKGFFDRVLQTGWAFGRGQDGSYLRGLTGRSGRLLVTMDAPGWYDRLAYGRSAIRHVRDATFKFCGIRPAKVTGFYGIEKTKETSREAMLEKARSVGAADARTLLRRLPPAVDLRPAELAS